MVALLKPVSFTQSGSSNTDRRPSPAIWGDCPWLAIEDGSIDGAAWFDDFNDFGLPGTQTTEINLGHYKVYNTGATKVTEVHALNSVQQYGGMIALTLDSDGDAAAIGTQACPWNLSTTLSGKLWFEARIATLSIATNDGQLFVGLGENDQVTFGAATPLANADAVSSGDAKVGFNRLEDGLGVLNASYADRAAAWTDIKASVGSIAAVTWTKVGMIFDPLGDPLRCLRFFVDNVESATAMTKAALLALTYLDANSLGLVAAVFADSGAATVLYMDWWKVAQVSRG